MTAPDPAVLAASRAADKDYDANPGRPVPPETAADLSRLLPAPRAREDAA